MNIETYIPHERNNLFGGSIKQNMATDGKLDTSLIVGPLIVLIIQ